MTLNLAGDAADIDPLDFARRLTAAVQSGTALLDTYSAGGAVAAFEARMAAALGKERAVLFATGTLANLLAVRAHARARHARRVIVQAEGHIANDSGDGAGELAGVTLRPIPHAAMTAEAVAREIALAAGARVKSPIAAVVVESPVRRAFGSTLSWADQGAICAIARDAGLGTHLDGARMFIAAGFGPRSVRELAAPYDTVYVSLYKYFGVPFGAVLAGPASILDEMYHERRRFGGGLNQMWPIAVVADAALDGQEPRWRAVAAQVDAVLPLLRAGGLTLVEAPHGTNVFRVAAADKDAVLARAAQAGIALMPPQDGFFALRANATWLDQTPAHVAMAIAGLFDALGSRQNPN